MLHCRNQMLHQLSPEHISRQRSILQIASLPNVPFLTSLQKMQMEDRILWLRNSPIWFIIVAIPFSLSGSRAIFMKRLRAVSQWYPLFAISFLSLFFELAVIRWVSGEVLL